MPTRRRSSLYRSRGTAPIGAHLSQLQSNPNYAGARASLGYLGCGNGNGSSGLGTLGMSFLTKVLRSATPGPNEFKLKSTPKEIKKVIAVAGPALSFIPGYGALAAAGAAVITRADQKLKAQKLANAGAGASLLQEYSGMAGQVPGRVFGLDNMSKVIDAIGVSGGWPNVKKWQSGVVAQALTTGCKGCTPPTMKEWVATKLSQGQNNPLQLVNDWTAWVNQAWGSKWLVGSAGEVQKQALIDTIDALIAQADPNAPLYYAQAAADPTAPVPVPVPGTGPGPAPGTLPSSGTGPGPGATPTPIPVPGAVPQAGDPAALQAYVQALMAQGQSQQQAFTSALAALGNSGQAVTPQVQAQVADAVQATGQAASFGAGLPTWALAGGLAILIGYGVIAGRKGSRSTRRR